MLKRVLLLFLLIEKRIFFHHDINKNKSLFFGIPSNKCLKINEQPNALFNFNFCTFVLKNVLNTMYLIVSEMFEDKGSNKGIAPKDNFFIKYLLFVILINN